LTIPSQIAYVYFTLHEAMSSTEVVHRSGVFIEESGEKPFKCTGRAGVIMPEGATIVLRLLCFYPYSGTQEDWG